jgi:hypothetical protein
MLRSIGYDAEERLLEVEFRDTGDVYRYADVEEIVFEQFLSAPSKGRYFSRFIRGNYAHTRLT